MDHYHYSFICKICPYVTVTYENKNYLCIFIHRFFIFIILISCINKKICLIIHRYYLIWKKAVHIFRLLFHNLQMRVFRIHKGFADRTFMSSLKSCQFPHLIHCGLLPSYSLKNTGILVRTVITIAIEEKFFSARSCRQVTLHT